MKEKFAKPSYFPKKTIRDPRTGRKVCLLDLGSQTVRPYVTQRQWTADGKSFVVGDRASGFMFLYNTEKETLLFLDEWNVGDSCCAYITPGDILFYMKNSTELWRMNLSTMVKEKLSDIPKERCANVIQATNDGRYLNCYWLSQEDEKDYFNGENRYRIIPRFDCETKEWDTTSVTHCFDEIPMHPNAGHPVINPAYGDITMFCHEGTTDDIPDRIWVGDYRTGETKNLFLQAELPNGRTGETVGHEMWGVDGEWAYFVKFGRETNTGQNGVMRVRKDGTGREYVNGDFIHWHCYASDDNRWIASDTQIPERTEVVLSSTESYSSYLLADCPFPREKNQHPYQPHPAVNTDATKVSWGMIDPDTGVLCAAWMDVSDLTSISCEGGWEVWGEIEYLCRKNTVSQVERREDGITISAEKALFVKWGKTEEDTSAVIEVTYLDEGTIPLVLRYTTGVKSKQDLSNRENAEAFLPRGNSGSWITERVVLESINLSKAGRFCSDVCVLGYGKVKEIKIR